MFLFTKTAVIKSDLQQLLLLMCFRYLSNKYKFSLQHFYLYFYRLYRLCTNSITGFVAQSFKKNQESLYYIDFRFLVDLVIIVFNK